MTKKGNPKKYINIVPDMYGKVRRMLGHAEGQHNIFQPITLHQDSTLSLFIASILDELTWTIQEDVPWCMLFADEIILIGDTREGQILG